jgi:hypothetical protein
MNDGYYTRARALLIRVLGRVAILEHDLALLANPEHKRVIPNEFPKTETLSEIKDHLEIAYVRMHSLRAQIDVHPQGTVLDIMRLAEKMGETL